MIEMRIVSSTLILLAISILIAGCGGSSSRSINNQDGHPHWTVLVFMAADNDLETFAIQDMNELEYVGSTPEVRVLVQMDRIPGYDSSNGNWTGTRRYYVTQDSNTSTINSQLIADLGERDMADPNELAEFIQWGTQNYPSDHYLLVLWDHGRGWRYRAMELAPRAVKSINLDETNNHSEMNMADISQALGQSSKMDVIAFDACLMGMIEVADALKDHADFMVASEENIPAAGLQYSTLLNSLTQSPSVTPEQLSGNIVEQYADHYISSYSGGITMSAIRLSSIDDLNTAVNGLAQSIINNMNESRSFVRAAQAATQHYDQDPPSDYYDYKDLYDFANRLTNAPSAPIRTAAQSTKSAIESAIVHERHSNGAMSGSHGISIYIPASGDTSLLPQYQTLTFAQSTQWDEFLAAY